MTQIEAAEVARKSRAMVGNATLTIVLSRTDIVIASAMAAIAQYRRGSGNPSGWAALAAAALGADIVPHHKAKAGGAGCHNAVSGLPAVAAPTLLWPALVPQISDSA
jgi:predicted anti-sigma-YlaC factor YlaD